MTSIFNKIVVGIAFLSIFAIAQGVSAQTYYGDPYSYGTNYQTQTYTTYPGYSQTYDVNAIIAQLLQIIEQLKQGNNNYTMPHMGGTPYGGGNYGGGYYFEPVDGGSNYYGDEPWARTEDADDVDEDSAELNGEVDMRGYDNGIVFFVYGQDDDMIEDVEDDYDTYDDVRDDEEDDEFEVERVDSSLDGFESYREDVHGLEEDERYYFIICVEYDGYDNDERLVCGDVEEFETDGDNNNDEDPEAETHSATNIDDDSARLRGEVDMNDFNSGRVFFVYGENENDVEYVENEDRYTDIEEQGDDLQKISVDSDLDGFDYYVQMVYNLNDNTDHYFRICVEYEDEDDDDTLECGDVEEFETD